MTQKPTSGKTRAAAREDRLKAALKANLGRRKAQARARTSESKDADETTGDTHNETSSEGS
ncbi:hypothetical protein [Marivita sp. S2033]|uniref:hypothetical protein n=1 Tax=Marivita sp. S2033 TaxID=3373187 RepID=UPI0039826585